MTRGGATARRPAARLALATAVLAASVFVAAESQAAKGDVRLVSKQGKGAGGQGANGNSNQPSISANGRLVAFRSAATNLGGPTQATDNIYVFNRKTQRLQLVSRRSQPTGGAGADNNSSTPSISAGGRFVAFVTRAQNLQLGQGSALDKVYVYDRKNRRVQLVSRQSKAAGGAIASGNSNNSAISGSGRFVVFNSAAQNLGGPIQTGINTYVYDRQRKRVELVSRRSKSRNGKGANESSTTRSAISHNGRFVAFASAATNLLPAAQPVDNCYVYDRKLRRIELVSRRSKNANGNGANGDCFNPRISAGGRFVAINTRATNLGADPTPGKRKIYVYDRKLKRIKLVSRQSKAAGGAPTQPPDSNTEIGSISADGRFVGFTSNATNLGGPIQAASNTYVYDRQRERVQLVSRKGGQGANGNSHHPALSATGRFVAFPTAATNLGGPLDPTVTNVYVFDRG